MSKMTNRPGKNKIRIGWVISRDRAWASSRLQGYLIHEWLVLNGYDSQILFENFNEISSVWSFNFVRGAIKLAQSNCDVVVFEGGEWPMAQLARLYRSLGKRAVGVRCDQISGEYDEYYDLTIVPTESLRQALKIKRGVVIEDSVEVRPDQFKRDYASLSKLRVVWVGHENYENYITSLVTTLKENAEINAQFDFELISKGNFATIQWGENTVASDILSCDIALIAIPQLPWFMTKSANRLALMMALGMPTVATLIPSYESLAANRENGLFVTSDEEIAQCLLQLKDQERRKMLGTNARKTVLDKYGIDSIAPKWVSALELAVHAAPVQLSISRLWSLISKLLSMAIVRQRGN